jgi:hypothetical protein
MPACAVLTLCLHYVLFYVLRGILRGLMLGVLHGQLRGVMRDILSATRCVRRVMCQVWRPMMCGRAMYVIRDVQAARCAALHRALCGSGTASASRRRRGA